MIIINAHSPQARAHTVTVIRWLQHGNAFYCTDSTKHERKLLLALRNCHRSATGWKRKSQSLKLFIFLFAIENIWCGCRLPSSTDCKCQITMCFPHSQSEEDFFFFFSFFNSLLRRRRRRGGDGDDKNGMASGREVKLVIFFAFGLQHFVRVKYDSKLEWFMFCAFQKASRCGSYIKIGKVFRRFSPATPTNVHALINL